MFESKKINPIQVSKWIKIPLLIDAIEMEDLLQSVPSFNVYDVQRVTGNEEGVYPSKYFLEKYDRYISYLKNKQIPPVEEFRSIFSTVWSVTESAIFSIPAQEGRHLLKTAEPAVQIQMNQIRYAKEENVFRNQVFGTDGISWGIQVGFPFLYLDPQTFETGHTRAFPNMALFLAIQRWIRHSTVPTPFLVNGQKINSPTRLGKKCFSWISEHPQLSMFEIGIDRR